jgi:hypothetical protein
LVIVGLPNFLSMTTLRPFGPSVAFTAGEGRPPRPLRNSSLTQSEYHIIKYMSNRIYIVLEVCDEPDCS